MTLGKMFNYFFLLIGTVVAVYLVLVIFVYFYQPRLLYFPNIPSRYYKQTPANIGLAYDSVNITTSDRITLSGWFLPAMEKSYTTDSLPEESNQVTMLFFHGNAGNISHRLDTLRLFHQLGLNTLIIDYRGYGQSGGKPDEEGTYIDAEAAWSYLVNKRKIPANKIILFGRSLGAAVAIDLASRKTPAALVIESAFRSVPALAKNFYPYLPISLISRYQYDNEKKLTMSHIPVLIIHSEQDDIIPYSHGTRLYEVANEPKEFLKLTGNHNNGFILNLDLYQMELRQFITNYL